MNRQSIRKVVLDCDGVLIDSFGPNLTIIQTVAAAMGRMPPTKDAVRSASGIPFKVALQTLLPGVSLEEFLACRDACGLHSVELPLFDGVAEVIDLLGREQGLPLSIVSNRDARTFKEVLGRSGLDLGRFLHLQCSDDTPYAKPDPRVFDPVLTLAAGMGIAAQEMLYVGDDHKVDCRPALDAGMCFIGICGPISTREEFIAAGADPDCLIGSVTELPRMLGAW